MSLKTVLITGGSRGIGRAIAQAFHAQGHRVAVTGRNREKLEEVRQTMPGVLALEADVADSERTQAVVVEAEATLGPVDVLVNNAGTGGSAVPLSFVDMDPVDWWGAVETNLKGPMLYCRAVLPGMLERRFGVIVNLGSYMAIRPMPMATAYASSKAALARFTDCLAADLKDSGVQVFCVSPGLVLTDMTRDMPFIKHVPPSEFNQPEDVAERVCRLSSGYYAALSGLFLHVGDDMDEQLESAARIHAESLHTLRLHGLNGLIQ
jgi:3-oxoacyl-[acyl-carrier protein] reductase